MPIISILHPLLDLLPPPPSQLGSWCGTSLRIHAMPRKAKSKPATNVTLTFKLSTATDQFTTHKLMKIGGFDWSEVKDDLSRMNFSKVDESAQTNNDTIKTDNDDDVLSYEELSPAGELTNAIAAFGQWFRDNNIEDNEHPKLIDNIRCLTMMFSLIPAPHQCPIPPLCVCPHQDDTLPCRCLHTNNIPPPPPCSCLHHDNKDTPMEPSTPTCAFSKTASQTPAPSHEVTMPPPPPAAAAPSPKPGPRPRPSYAGAAVKNLNPAAPPFMHGPPHAPVAPPTQAPRVSLKP
ncbi:hypothetical protein P691DRAFT_768154 [Macrolepiota fuliginosa MF-IS2]|uniref:Uncharacterized protein n=1 Tax=Macrolepiota fuliginosa MF-IS2 TaxID=1400762 RepID=A0A9P5WYC0_9AGAR|nr:hypothetical protein P691DRAFT_768154 [Macrolepiota fuliginosa MF-IS2]